MTNSATTDLRTPDLSALFDAVSATHRRSAELKRLSIVARVNAAYARATGCREADDRIRELEAELDGLRQALATRAPIEQAKGIIMATERCDAETAFEVLVRRSQARNRKLREVAADVVADTFAPPPRPTA